MRCSKHEESGDEKYIDKARRRGKVGWNVGRQIEVIPHYRRPHMALVWTGHGRAVPRVGDKQWSHKQLLRLATRIANQLAEALGIDPPKFSLK